MNKQEAIEKINESRLAFAAILSRRNGKRPYFEKEVVVMKEKDLVDIINQIEPEKPVVPQFVAEHIEYHKGLNSPMGDIFNRHFIDDERIEVWLREAPNAYDNLGKAWLFGYEVEEEKLYTAKLKIITNGGNNYLNKHSDTERFTLSNLYTASGAYQTSFTQSELEELGIWNNPAFEIEEVTNE